MANGFGEVESDFGGWNVDGHGRENIAQGDRLGEDEGNYGKEILTQRRRVRRGSAEMGYVRAGGCHFGVLEF
jgi:hypothetical protein